MDCFLLYEQIHVNIQWLQISRHQTDYERTEAITQTFSLKPGGKLAALYCASVKESQPSVYRLVSRCSR